MVNSVFVTCVCVIVCVFVWVGLADLSFLKANLKYKGSKIFFKNSQTEVYSLKSSNFLMDFFSYSSSFVKILQRNQSVCVNLDILCEFGASRSSDLLHTPLYGLKKNNPQHFK